VPTTFRAKLFSGLTGTKRRRRQSPTDATVSIPADHDDRNPTTTDSHRTGWTPSATIWTFFKKARSKR